MTEVLSQVFVMLSDMVFLRSFGLTVYRFMLGLCFSLALCAVMIPVGLRSQKFAFLIETIVSIFQPIPKVVVFPILLIFFGISDSARVLLIGFGLFFTNYLVLASAAKQLILSPANRIISFYKISPKQLFYGFYMKGLAPALSSALKNSSGYGLTLTIISESYFSNNGIGYLIWRHWERYELLELVVVIVSISIFAVALNLFWRLTLERL